MEETFYKLTFKESIIDAILCLDAVLPGNEIFSLFKSIPIIAADGASFKLYEKSIIPNYIIGDLDTFSSNPISDVLKTKAEVIYLPEQETNDFEKSLRFCLKKGWKNIMIFGLHGGALEHTLNNLSIIKRLSRLMNLCVYDEERYGIPVYSSIKFNVEFDEIISIIPQPYVKLTTKGLQWELKNEVLELGIRDGARNRARADLIEIQLHEGEYFLFMNHRLPMMPYLEYLDK